MNYNHMSGCGDVLIIRPSFGGQHPYIGSTSCYQNRRGVLCKVVLYAGKQPFQLGNQGVNSRAIWFRLSLAGPVSFHVLGISLLPRLLAVLAQRAIERVFVQLLAVVIGAAATLAVTGAADHLVRMAAQWLKLLAAVRACPNFEVSWAHDCITTGAMLSNLAHKPEKLPTRAGIS
jgi:hypothetical protein